MRSIPRLFAAIASIAFLYNQPARGEDPAVPTSSPAPTVTQAAGDGVPLQMPDTSGEKWRFRQHQGLWWYWLPSEKWVYWHDGRWVPYDQATYAALRRSLPGRQHSYSRGRGNQDTSGYPELGEWGRVRYDSYGNRQYPYSMRRSGIRQLGPVPAMGGVRSLPGWGGER